MVIQTRDRVLTLARRLFSEQGAVPDGIVAAPILRSWRRCIEQGFDMGDTSRQEPMTQVELRELRQRHAYLRRMCQPAIALLRREARVTGGLVILADADGLVLESAGATDFASRASRVALMPGAPWDEHTAGTNAIGTALIEGRAIAVHGAEHFFTPNRILACAAMPITDPQGRIIGVLDLSGDARCDHRYAMGMVGLAVAQVERRMFAETYADCLLMGLHADPAWLDTPREGVVAFRDDVLVAANRQALGLLGIGRAAIGVYLFEDVFATRIDEILRGADRVQTHVGATLHVRSQCPASEVRRHHVSRAVPPSTAEASLHARSVASHHVSYDAVMLDKLARAVHVSDAGVSVLLQGETGVGKEVFAQQMHGRGRRRAGPFIAVNCAALPESLIESELFGYEEGAFTGARRQGSKGLLRQAHGGTLFLDEIGDMPLALQARLLRVLQTREICPLGGGRPVTVDFALICATHRALSVDESPSVVRPDLYFRIAEYAVVLTPLRERADLRDVVCAIWAGFPDAPRLPKEIENLLVAYTWPGNYRQLVSALKTLWILGSQAGRVRMDMLPAELLRTGAAASVARETGSAGSASPLRELTTAAMRRAVEQYDGNVSRAARELGVHRSTLYRRLGESAASKSVLMRR
ncbi:sigma-54-dependent Fis family transcriptional regulator [Allopusillimonas ginsengisoli]|uniref:sigma-54-dependent Fis family transcriptional regulator n=1 Tax=Allopusillimonas ginsengisoli TaxID=453575 RepID=UPI0039C0C549